MRLRASIDPCGAGMRAHPRVGPGQGPAQYWSAETTSPPARVARAHQTPVRLIVLLIKRTLPSQNRMLAPPGWKLAGPSKAESSAPPPALSAPLIEQVPNGASGSLGTWM